MTSPNIPTMSSDIPRWFTKESEVTMKGGYIAPGELSVNDAILRVARAVHRRKPELNILSKVYDYIHSGYICLSTPIWCNFGNDRGFPISCYGSYVGDSVEYMGSTLAEIMSMSKFGGGTSLYLGDIRSRGSLIKSNGGKAKGVKPYMGIVDNIISVFEQGEIRKGAIATYIDFDHGDISEFLGARTVGDEIQRSTTGICISNNDIKNIYNGDRKALETYASVLEARNATGTPYIFYVDNANFGKSTPSWYGHNNGPKRKIKASNLCTEIMLPSWYDESFVCCLLSLNAFYFDEWPEDVAEIATYILDAVNDEFIEKASQYDVMSKTVNFATRHRSIGIGVLGWHSYLQSKNLPYISLSSNIITNTMFKGIRKKADMATKRLAGIYGGCEVSGGTVRNATVLAVAPTVSNATIAGGVSANTECQPTNYYVQGSSKGSFTRKNVFLEEKLDAMGYNTKDVWDEIRQNEGSVLSLDFLSDADKDVFKTFKEVNQFHILEQFAIRQQYIDQGQSINLNIPPDTDPKVVSSLYLYAHKLGLKSLYYQRSQSVLRGAATMDIVCSSCDG